MSIEETVEILNKFVGSASCHSCGRYYEQPKLASCGHRMCNVCWKTKKRCYVCNQYIDHTYLQEDVLMTKLAKAVRRNLQKFRNLDASEDVWQKLSLGKGWVDKSVPNWLGSSQNHFSIPPTQTQDAPLVPTIITSNETNNRTIVKTVSQDDYDKIECLKETQTVPMNEMKNSIGQLGIVDFIFDSEEHTKENTSLRRSNRNKPHSYKVLTEAIIESHSDTTVNNDKRPSQNKPLSDKNSSKAKPWKSVRNMNKVLNKLNKRDVKKLNVSVEMCKKMQNVISKSTVQAESTVFIDQAYTIEDDTPRVTSLAQLESVNYIPSGSLLTLTNQKTPTECVKQYNQIDYSKDTSDNEYQPSDQILKENKPEDRSIQERRLSRTEADMETLNNSLTSALPQTLASTQKNIAGNTKEKLKINPDNYSDIAQSVLCQIARDNNDGHIIDQIKLPTMHSGGKKRKLRNTRTTVNSLKQGKIINKILSTNRFKPFNQYKRRYERKIGILNVTTPEGKFLITGENICVIKTCISSTEKGTQTEINQGSNSGPTGMYQTNDQNVQNEAATCSPAPMNESSAHSQVNINPTQSFTKQTKDPEKSAKASTASGDTTTGPYKITESVEKELVSEMECIEESDIFNTCSGNNKLHHASTDKLNRKLHSELIAGSSQTRKKSTQRSKRQQGDIDGPLQKKAKHENNVNHNTISMHYDIIDVPDSQSQYQSSKDKEVIKQVSNSHTHEFDEITSKAFAQIDADLCEHNNKNKSEQAANQELEHHKDDNEENDLNLNTPITTQNDVMNIDSDSSFVEGTPQKDKSAGKQTFINDTIQRSSDDIDNKKFDRPTAESEIAPQKVNMETDMTEKPDTEQSPHTLTFCHGITNESTPARPVSRRSLNFNKMDAAPKCSEALNIDSFTYHNSSGASDLVKTTLEKEFMEKAFEKTPHVTHLRKSMSLRKEISPREVRRIQLACSCLSQDEKIEIIKFAKKQNWEFTDTYTPELTHLIVGVDDKKAQRTVKYIYALAAGKWILSFEWISQCIKSNGIVDEAPYEVLDMSGDQGPQLSRTAKTKLFEGMTFYCHPPFNILERKSLEGILETAGGRVTQNIEEVSLENTSAVAMVIAEPQSTIDQQYTCLAIDMSVVPVNCEWAFNCLGSYSLQPLLLLCPSSLITIRQLNWPHQLLENSYSNDEMETQ